MIVPTATAATIAMATIICITVTAFTTATTLIYYDRNYYGSYNGHNYYNG